MMTLLQIEKSIFGQRDPDFGDAVQRLELNSSSLPNGYCPYPRAVISVESQTPTAAALNEAYCKYYNTTQFPSLKPGEALVNAAQRDGGRPAIVSDAPLLCP